MFSSSGIRSKGSDIANIRCFRAIVVVTAVSFTADGQRLSEAVVYRQSEVPKLCSTLILGSVTAYDKLE
jgi:hypothetical protein